MLSFIVRRNHTILYTMVFFCAPVGHFPFLPYTIAQDIPRKPCHLKVLCSACCWCSDCVSAEGDCQVRVKVTNVRSLTFLPLRNEFKYSACTTAMLTYVCCIWWCIVAKCPKVASSSRLQTHLMTLKQCKACYYSSSSLPHHHQNGCLFLLWFHLLLSCSSAVWDQSHLRPTPSRLPVPALSLCIESTE